MRGHEHIGDAELLLAIDREASPRQLEIIDAHIAGCASCRQRFAEWQGVDAHAAEVVDADLGVISEVSPRARARLSRALHTAGVESRRWWDRAGRRFGVPTRMFPLAALAAAAAMALLVVAPMRRFDVTGDAPLPNASLTPGAVSSLTAAELCGGVWPSRVVTAASRRTVLHSYQMEHVSDDLFELDALVTPELGGTTAPGNLWPQRYDSPVWNAAVKDQLERLLPELVCGHRLALSEAQRDIATDWIAAYKKHFRTDVPFANRAGSAVEDDDLVFERSAPERHSDERLVRGLRRFRASLFPQILLPSAALARGFSVVRGVRL